MVEAVGDRTGLVVVAQSYGGFTAPLVCGRLPADLLVRLAAMVPRPGERPDDWWANTGYAPARREHDGRNGAPADDIALFLHDVPPDLAAEAMRRERDQSATPGEQPWPLPAWPDVPTRFLLCRDDRFFPADFLRRVVQDRLAITPDEIDGSHLRRPQPPQRAGRPPGVVPGRVVGRRVAGVGYAASGSAPGSPEPARRHRSDQAASGSAAPAVLGEGMYSRVRYSLFRVLPAVQALGYGIAAPRCGAEA